MTIFHIFANKETCQESYSLIEKIALPATRAEKFMAQLHHSAQPEKTNRISLNGF